MSRAPSVLDAAVEAELLARLRDRSRAGYEAAFDELFVAYRGPIVALCLHVTGSHAEAEDAAQEVFLAAHRHLAAFRGEARLATWLYRVAIRAALRVRARRPRAEEVPVDAPAPGADAEENAARREEVVRLLRAMAALPVEHRVVLALFAIRGLAHAEIAAILGVPVGTVWSRLHEARSRLAQALGRG